MTFVSQILSDFSHLPSENFFTTWATLTAAAAIATAWAVARATTRRAESQGETMFMPTRRPISAPQCTAALVFLGAILAFYIAMALVWAHFTYYDDSYFTLLTLRGHDIGPPILRPQGRFFPLGFQEFDLIRHFTDTNFGYQIFPLAQLLILVCVILVIDQELSITARAGLAILVLLTPSILISFTGLIFPERNVVFFLALLIFFLKRFEQTLSTPWAVAAAVCAQFMLYYKETAFLLVLGLAAGRLIFRCKGRKHDNWNYERLWDKEGRLDFILIGLAILFFVLYLYVMGYGRDLVYADLRRQPLAEILLAYLRLDWLSWVMVAVVLSRICLILGRRADPMPLWDGLALGGAACFVAYLYLRLFEPWYLAPVDFIGVLYVGRLAFLLIYKRLSWHRIAIFGVSFAIILQNIFFSTVFTYEYKNVIHAKAEVARVVEAQHHLRPGAPLRLFFPFASRYVIMLFAAYLDYHGLPSEGVNDAGSGRHDLVLVARGSAKIARCVWYQGFLCHAGSRPDPGDLVIVLPDDEASSAQAAPYRTHGKLLFLYEPRPPMPSWLHSLARTLIGNLRMTSPVFAHTTLPDRSMDASVTRWN